MNAKEFEKKTVRLVRDNVKRYPHRNDSVYDVLFDEIQKLLGAEQRKK